MQKVDLSIVIVTFNSEGTIRECIESIYDTIEKNSFEVLISDNSPNKNTQEAIKPLLSKYKGMTYQFNDANLGFSKGNNAVVKKTRGEYVLFLNPDTMLHAKTVDGMIEFMKKHPDCGASTCAITTPTGAIDDTAHRGFPTPWRSFTHFAYLSKLFPKSKHFAGYSMGYLDYSKLQEIDALAGSFMLMPHKLGEELGWWDEDFFFYGEDIDFCYRIKERGFKIYYVPQFTTLHIKGVSSGIKKESEGISKATKSIQRMLTKHRFQAMRIFYDKHYKDSYPSFFRFLVLFAVDVKWRIADFKYR